MRHPFRRNVPSIWLWRILFGGAAFVLLAPLLIVILTSPMGLLSHGLFLLAGTWCFGFIGLLLGWSVLLGLYRASAFDPILHKDYYDWLLASPWRAKAPLPKGPIRIVWQDVLLMALICLAYHGPLQLFDSSSMSAGQTILMLSWFSPIIWFLSGYLVVRVLVLICRNMRPFAYGIIGILFIGFCFGIWGFLPALVASLLLCQVATYRWRDRLQRVVRGELELPILQLSSRVRGQSDVRTLSGEKPPALAWPHDKLSKVEDKPRIVLWEGTTIALLVGLLVFALTRGARLEITDVCVLAGVASVGGALTRLLHYCLQCWPPISLMGRIFTFRWIIPGYDYVFLPALMILAVPFLVYGYFSIGKGASDAAAPLETRIVLSAAFGLVMFIGLNAGPRLSRFLLIARARLSPFGTNNRLSRKI